MEVHPMRLVQSLIEALASWLRPRDSISSHTRNQAYGPRWSRHRSREIGRYVRRRSRRGWWDASRSESKTMNTSDLEELYQATGEDLLFAVGLTGVVLSIAGERRAPDHQR